MPLTQNWIELIYNRLFLHFLNSLHNVPLSISLFPTVSIHHSSLILPPQPWESVVVRRTTNVDNLAAAVLIYDFSEGFMGNKGSIGIIVESWVC